MSDLSTRVRLRREQLGLSQQELARRMGYRSRSSITKLEKGINDLPQSKVEELAQGVSSPSRAAGVVSSACASSSGGSKPGNSAGKNTSLMVLQLLYVL